MKKRIVAFLVCAAMIGSLLAGCGNGGKREYFGFHC